MSNFKPLMSPEAYRIVIHNARSMARGADKRSPNWSFAMLIFSCGSTHGWAHCEAAEIDPDGVTVGEIWRRKDGPQHDHQPHHSPEVTPC